MSAKSNVVVFAIVSVSACAAYAQTNPPKPQPGITVEGQRGSQRSRGAEGTREFLGLGPAPDAAAAERGEKLYSASCAFCHGAKANGGDTGPDLLRSTLVLHDEKGELISQVVHEGRVSRGMPQFAAFSSAELYDIAEFLHMRIELAANRGTYKILNVVTGDPKAGEVYFRTTGGCAGCHSTTGDLAHIGAKLSPPDLQQTLLYPAARGTASGAEADQQVTVTLPSGERLTGRVKHLDDFNVSLIDTQGEFHSVAIGKNIRVEMQDRLLAHRQLLDKYTDSDMHNLTAYLATLK